MANSKLYPLKFIPEPRERVWGGSRLNSLLNKNFNPDDYPSISGNSPIGESWEISGMIDDSSIIENGFFSENSLEEFVDTYMGDAIGDNLFQYYRGEFPLLVKFLDVHDRLSLQVHPDNQTAMEREYSNGKAECWYIMEADETARIYMGFNRDLTPTEFYNRCKDGTVTEVLNVIKPKKGDFVYIAPGTVHAAEGGIVIAEVQQCSDITYRLYDWGREFNPQTARTMHLNEAIDIIDYKRFNPLKYYSNVLFTLSDIPLNTPTDNKEITVCNTEYFIVKALEIAQQKRVYPLIYSSFIIYIAVDGEMEIRTNDKESYTIKRGECIMIPAGMEDFTIQPIGNDTADKNVGSRAKNSCRVLEVYLPQPPEDHDSYVEDDCEHSHEDCDDHDHHHHHCSGNN